MCIIVVESGRDMFFGQKEITLDDKSRVVLPAIFKEDFANFNQCVLTYGFDKCIEVYTPDVFDQKSAKYIELSRFNPKARSVQRTFFANSGRQNIDANGRILLSKNLKDIALINKDVVILGMYDHLEIWAKELYEEVSRQDQESYSDNAQELIG